MYMKASLFGPNCLNLIALSDLKIGEFTRILNLYLCV
jgi:hypothetical protein